ncbi:nucleolar protein 16 [Chelonus insularis]|uniref:nucleolar protein 16 n=1 Tax=Chelonus insularis TaxID=460826 RepID=UPI00158DC58A|nr:nucleolar protein 16 [Chelonus insularis]
MPKLRKVRRSKKYRHNVNRKRLRNKQRKMPNISCTQIKEAWDNKKSTRGNLAQMGLAYDANDILKIPNIKQEMKNNVKKTASGEFQESEDEPQPIKRAPKKIEVAMKLEAEAKAPRERMFKLPKGQVQFLTYLMDKYNDDYKAMARDKKNYYQLTWKQIRSKINVFKGIPEQYAEYLLRKGEIVLEDPIPFEETKKKIAEENLKKYCAPKKEKKKQPSISQWIEENINGENDLNNGFNTKDTLTDLEGDQTQSDKSKKLKLFPDDEENDKKSINKKKNTKKVINKQTKSSSESDDSDEELENDDELQFKDLSDMSDEELSDDDMLDDEDFATDSADDSDEE